MLPTSSLSWNLCWDDKQGELGQLPPQGKSPAAEQQVTVGKAWAVELGAGQVGEEARPRALSSLERVVGDGAAEAWIIYIVILN